MTGYNFFHRALTERIGEIEYDIGRTKNTLEDYEQELREAKEELRELEESKDKFIGFDESSWDER